MRQGQYKLKNELSYVNCGSFLSYSPPGPLSLDNKKYNVGQGGAARRGK